MRDAEILAAQAIEEGFRQDPSLARFEVTVLGERNGEIVPLLVVSVSRSQWQETPQVSAWVEYNDASYALLQRHEEEETVAAAPSVPAAASRVRSFADAGEVQRAYDEGRLSGEEAQLYLDDLD